MSDTVARTGPEILARDLHAIIVMSCLSLMSKFILHFSFLSFAHCTIIFY
jgi:hypothetical protein